MASSGPSAHSFVPVAAAFRKFVLCAWQVARTHDCTYLSKSVSFMLQNGPDILDEARTMTGVALLPSASLIIAEFLYQEVQKKFHERKS